MAESLNCAFYKYTGDPRVANKSFPPPDQADYSCALITPLEPLSDIDVKLIISYPDNTAGKPAVMTANYVAIDGLYYQITNKERLPGNALAIYATIDGLLSYWGQVSLCNGTCARNETRYNSQFADEKYMLLQNREIETKVIGSFIPFGDFSIVMCANGTLPKSNGNQGTTTTYQGQAFGGGGGHW